MKYFPIVLLLLLVFDGLKLETPSVDYEDELQGLTLPQEGPDQGLNTSLLANFSGIYVRKNPCSNKEVETSSYEASHEFHHCNKEQNWTDLTDKCSALISGFLKSVCNLINFNNKRDGTLTLNVNTTISKKQADQQNCKDEKYSLPTIVIKATNYGNSEQNEKREKNALTVEGPKQKAVNGMFGKQKFPIEEAFEELSANSQESSTSRTFRKEAEADLPVRITERPQKTYKRAHVGKPERFTHTRNFEATQESENAFKQIRDKYVAEQPKWITINSEEEITPQADAVARLTLGSTEKSKVSSDNHFRNSEFETKPTRHFEAVPNREKFSSLSQSQSLSNGVRTDTSDFILPAPSTTQQLTTPLFSGVPKLPHNNNPNLRLTTVSPKNSVKKQRTVEEVTEFSEKSESRIASNALETTSLNSNINPPVRPIQPAESVDYLKKQTAAGLPEYLPTMERFEQGNLPAQLPYGKKQPQMLKQSDILSQTPLTSETSPGTSIAELAPQTHLDATQPQPENLFQQSFDYPISEEINQASSYSQRETQLTSSEERTELYHDEQCNTTLPPESVDPADSYNVTPPAFPVDEFSVQEAGTPGGVFEFPSQKGLPSTINEKAGNVYNTQPASNPFYTRHSHQKTTPVQPAESLIRANQGADEATMQGPLTSPATQYEEEVMDQFQSSKQSDSTYAQISEITLDNNQNFPRSPSYDNMENRFSRAQLKSKAVLDKENTRSVDYLRATSQPMLSSYDKKIIKNLPIRPERREAGQLENFNEQTKSFKSSKNRPPVTEPATDATAVTYSSQKEVVSSLQNENEITESSTTQASQAKPLFYSSHIPNYGRPTPSQDNLFVSDSSVNSDTVKYDRSDSLTIESSSSSSGSIASGSKNQIISEEPRPDYYDVPDEQPSSNRNNAAPPLGKLLEDSTITPYSGFKPKMTTTVHESDAISSQQNQQLRAPATRVYDSQTISTPRPIEIINPLKFQHNAKNTHASRKYNNQSNTPKTVAPEHKKNFDSSTTNHPPSEFELGNVSVKPGKFSDPLPLILTPNDMFRENAVKTTDSINPSAASKSFTLKPLGYQTSPSLPEVLQPLRISTNTPGKNQLPAVTHSQSRTAQQFSETSTDSSDVYSHQTSSAKVPVSASQNVEGRTSDNVRQDSLLIVDSESKKASASEESYYLNQNKAEIFSEENQYDDIASSQDARTQIPQPQPSFDYSDYSGQLSRNERESNTASTDLQTSKTFEGSKPNIQPLLTYSPLPSVPAKIKTFTTESYKSGDVANEYSDEPKPIGSALEKAETSSPFSAQNTETIDITEVSEVYSTPTFDGRFVPTTPSPPLTTIEEPLFVETSLPTEEKYSVSETFFQDTPTTPRPQYTNSVQYDQDIITIDNQPIPSPTSVTLLPVNYSGQLLNRNKGQGFGGGNLAATQHTEDRLERFDDKVIASESSPENTNRGLRKERVVQSSNTSENTEAISTALVEKKTSFKQLPARGVTLPLFNNGTNNLLKAETNAHNFGLTTSTVRPLHAKTTFDEEVIATDSSNSMSSSSTQASPVSHPERLSNGHFDGQRRHLLNPTTSQFSRQFYPENRPLYHPHPGFPSQHQFENRPYGNYPHPMDFNPQAPRPRFNHFDDFAREQNNQYPTSFQHSQFGSRFPDQFQPGLDTQRDRFMFPGRPSNYGSRYFPDGNPNFRYNQPPRSGMTSEPFSSPHVPPNFHSFQYPGVSEERDFQHQSRRAEERLAEENFNTQLTASHYGPSFEPYSYRPRDDFNERFGSNYQSFGPQPRDRFHPDQIPYNQMMPPHRNPPAGHFNPHGPPFLNNSSQQVEGRYQPHTYDRQKTDLNQASPEVMDDYKRALTGLASGERLVKFDEEVITISPEKGSNFEPTFVTEEREQRQDEATTASYNLREHESQKTGFLHEIDNTTASGQMPDGSLRDPPYQARPKNSVFRAQNRHLPSSSPQNHPMPFPQSVDSFGPHPSNPLPNASNQFRSVSSDFQQQTNANFVSSHMPSGGSVVGWNPSQSDSHAVGPHQNFPSSTPEPSSSRRSNVPSQYRNPVARPHPAPETFSIDR